VCKKNIILGLKTSVVRLKAKWPVPFQFLMNQNTREKKKHFLRASWESKQLTHNFLISNFERFIFEDTEETFSKFWTESFIK
jgi:hypothetical protein